MTTRQGYRSFKCEECGCGFFIATRDHTSPSVESCPKCNADVGVDKHWPVEGIKVDHLGNLVVKPEIHIL